MREETRVILKELVLTGGGKSRREIAAAVFSATGEPITTYDVSRMVEALRFSGVMPPRRGQYIKWSPEKLAELRALAGRVNMTKIAEHFGVSRDAINAQGRHLGITFRVVGQHINDILNTKTPEEETQL